MRKIDKFCWQLCHNFGHFFKTICHSKINQEMDPKPKSDIQMFIEKIRFENWTFIRGDLNLNRWLSSKFGTLRFRLMQRLAPRYLQQRWGSKNLKLILKGEECDSNFFQFRLLENLQKKLVVLLPNLFASDSSANDFLMRMGVSLCAI